MKIQVSPPHALTHETDIPTVPDALLLAFRQAARIEHRLLELENWVQANPGKPTTWTIATMRLGKLLSRRPELEPLGDACHQYLLSVFESASDAQSEAPQ